MVTAFVNATIYEYGCLVYSYEWPSTNKTKLFLFHLNFFFFDLNVFTCCFFYLQFLFVPSLVGEYETTNMWVERFFFLYFTHFGDNGQGLGEVNKLTEARFNWCERIVEMRYSWRWHCVYVSELGAIWMRMFYSLLYSVATVANLSSFKPKVDSVRVIVVRIECAKYAIPMISGDPFDVW